MKNKKTIKGWAIMPAFHVNKEVEIYLTDDYQFMIYLTKEAAEKANENLDEMVVPCEIKFYEKN